MGRESLALVMLTRQDGRKQGYWVKDGSGAEAAEDPVEMRRANAGRQAAASKASKERKEKLLDGTSTSPAAADPSPHEPPPIDFSSKAASEAVAQAQKEKWSWKGTPHPKAAGAMKAVANALRDGLAKDPGKETLLGFPVNHVVSAEIKGGALGFFSPQKGDGKIVLANSVAKEIQAAMVAGEVTSHKTFGAFEVLTHEAGHAASRMHQFEGINAPASSSQGRPHAAMEEGTTEIVGQHYTQQVIEGMGLKLNLKDAGAFGLKAATGAPMFEYDATTGDMPRANVPVGYHSFCRNIAAMAMVAEDAKTPEEVGNATVNWAITLKRTRGGLRYERLADRMLEPHLKRDKDDDLYRGAVEYAVNAGGALPVKDPPPFTAARQELAEHLKMLVGTNKSIRVSMLRAHVQSVAKKYQKGK